ncbi:dihydrofolate reductase family protein [Pontibacter populi]|uniref:Dihydrofolate reductase family protein n=1 Tax=Pontibacter populi TaxID=890055 RepID=A0ABV1RYT1_9BACT
MRKLILYIAASLDGYIARTDGSFDWLEHEAFALEGEDYGYSDFMQTIDTTLMGHSTYKAILGMDMPFPYTDKTNYVFSRSSHEDTEQVQYVNDDPITFVKQLQQQPGKDIWLIGGGQLNTLFFNAGMIDEIILTYVPFVLGKGIPLFAPIATEQRLQVTETQNYKNGFVQLRLSQAGTTGGA